MKILHLKYKMHKLVNLVFYLIIFGIGFLLGFSAEKINFNKLISQFLFIDNVNARTIATHNGITINEEFIYNSFNTYEDFNFNDYSLIYTDLFYRGADEYLNIHALPNNFFEITTLSQTLETKVGGATRTYVYTSTEPFIYYRIQFINKNYSNVKVEKKEGSTFKLFNTETVPPYPIWYTNFVQDYFFKSYELNYGGSLDFSIYLDSNNDDNTGDDNTGGDNTGDDNTGDDNTGGDNTGDDNTGDDNTGGDNTGGDNTGGDNTDEDIEIGVVNSGFYEFAQKIFGEVSEENKFIYDFITFGLVVTCFTLFVLVVGYIFNKFFGG